MEKERKKEITKETNKKEKMLTYDLLMYLTLHPHLTPYPTNLKGKEYDLPYPPTTQTNKKTLKLHNSGEFPLSYAAPSAPLCATLPTHKRTTRHLFTPSHNMVIVTQSGSGK
jgi:hypothetical protein